MTMTYEEYLAQQRAKYGETPDPFGGALTKGYDAFVDAAKGALATPPDTSPSDMTNDRFAQEGRKFLMENDPALLQPEVRNGILYKNGTPSMTFTQGRSTDQQRKMSPFSMTPPSFPQDQKIGLNEALIRMGGKTYGGALQGNFITPMTDEFGAIQDYNRAVELAKFNAEADQYNKGLEAYQKAQKAKGKGKGVDSTAMLGSIVVNDAISRALPLVSNWSSGVGSVFSVLPATDATNLEKLLDTVKANAGFDKLNAMRQASPTGGALGQVSDKEIRFLQSVYGSLDQEQRPAQLKRTLETFQWAYNTMIHGLNGHPYPIPEGMDIQPLLDAMYTAKGLPIPQLGQAPAQGGVDPQTQASIDEYANKK